MNLKAVILLTGVLLVLSFQTANAQNNNSLSIEKANSNIARLQTDLDHITAQMNQLFADEILYKQAQQDGSWNKYSATKQNVLAEIESWKKIKLSLENPGVSNTLAKEKIKIKKSDFDALPEVNRNAILTDTNTYEIVAE